MSVLKFVFAEVGTTPPLFGAAPPCTSSRCSAYANAPRRRTHACIPRAVTVALPARASESDMLPRPGHAS